MTDKNESHKNWIQTYTGKQFWPLDPKPEHIDIIDIAHALSFLCRFNGHSLKFYSVAEHCVRASYEVKKEIALWGLLHDAAEAYLSDFPRPIKRQIPIYKEMENRLLKIIIEHFGLKWPVPDDIPIVDNRLLVTEARDLMVKPPAPWNINHEPYPEKIIPLTPEQAEQDFMNRFEELKN